jgi:hypothetical protein
MKVTTCRICKNKKLKLIFSLGKQPLANNLPANPSENTPVYPLELVQCSHCGLIQLSYVVPKEKLFDNYFYIPSVSATYLKHFEEIATMLIKRFNLKKGDVIVDVGGSDGSLLTMFEKRGMKVINIEPAKNIKSQVFKITSYFTKDTVQKVVKEYGKAKLVMATNVFAHIDDLTGFIQNLDILLDQDGIFFAQFPDVRNLLKENQFDTIYHEHLSYFTTEPLYHLFSNTPLEILKIESSEIHGGSMRIFVKKRDKTLENFVTNVKIIKDDVNSYLREAKIKGKKIVGYGAAAKGMVLLYYCGLDNSIIDYIADGTPYKQNKFTPGTNIVVKAEEELVENTPDIILILAWNFKEEIISKVRSMLGKKGKDITFVVPIPTMEVIR